MNQQSIKQTLVDLQFYNNIGQINPSESFNLFGVVPTINSYFIVGCKEWWNKSITGISIHIIWQKEGLPEDFSEYYKSYPYPYDNGTFKVNFEYLKNGIWNPINKSPIRLFEEREEDNQVLETSTFNLKFPKKLIFNESVEVEMSSELTNEVTEGFIRMNLVEPEVGFGHDAYQNTLYESLKEKIEWVAPIIASMPYNPLVEKVAISITYLKI